MSTFRVQKNRENPYVMLDKCSINDSSISWKAKGLLAYLISKPDDWIVKEHDLIAHAKDGRDSTRSAIKELIDAGYLVRYGRRRDGKGRMFENEYQVFERPSVVHSLKRLSDSPTPENPSLGRGVTRVAHKSIGSNRENRELEAFKADRDAEERRSKKTRAMPSCV